MSASDAAREWSAEARLLAARIASMKLDARKMGAMFDESQTALDTQFYAQLRATAEAVCEYCRDNWEPTRSWSGDGKRRVWRHFSGNHSDVPCYFGPGWEFWFNLLPTKGGSDDAE